MTTIEVSAEAGPLPRPKGDQGAQHTGNAGEASGASLTNTHSKEPSAETSVVVTATSPRLRIELPKDRVERTALLNVLYQAQRMSAHAANAIARALWRADGAQLDAFVAEHGRLPKTGKEHPMPKGNWYQLARAATPELYAGGVASIARDVVRKWGQVRWDVLVRQTQRPLAYRDTYPVPLRAQELVVRDLGDDLFEISCPLFSGKGQRLCFPVRARDALERSILARVSALPEALGASRVVRDQKGRWYVQIVYKQLVERVERPRYAALNRGIRNFLVAVDEAGESWVVEGGDIEAVLKQLGRRRRQLQGHARSSARAGRGRRRILKPLESLQAKGARWRDTRIKTIAARFTQWLLDRGVGTLFLEDLTGIREGELATDGWKPIRDRIHQWPFDQLRQAIAHRCSTAGIEVVAVPSEYISQTCGACGAVHADHVDLSRWQMRCKTCGWRAGLDENAARNVLARGLGERSGAPPALAAESQGFGGRGRRARRTSRKTTAVSAKQKGSSGTGRSGDGSK